MEVSNGSVADVGARMARDLWMEDVNAWDFVGTRARASVVRIVTVIGMRRRTHVQRSTFSFHILITPVCPLISLSIPSPETGTKNQGY
jgi:hypothetical protein